MFQISVKLIIILDMIKMIIKYAYHAFQPIVIHVLMIQIVICVDIQFHLEIYLIIVIALQDIMGGLMVSV